MIKILIADDHAVVRAGLRQILAEQADMAPPGEAANGREVLESVRREKWDVVILDITFPDKNGIEILKEIREEKPDLPVLILSMHPEDQFALRALKAGAAGYMTKEGAADELVSAIRKVLDGGKFITPSLAERLAANLKRDAAKNPHDILSDREFEILCLIASGKTVGEIAQKIFLSVKTVSTYRARLLEKMNMHTNAELVHYAIQNRLAG